VKRLVLLAALAALAVTQRERLVGLLTRTTGTWVGSRR
jgi:hypothetical protein